MVSYNKNKRFTLTEKQIEDAICSVLSENINEGKLGKSLGVKKHGKYQPYTITTKCPECGCVFEFDPWDDTVYDSIWDESVVNCPECDYVIRVFDGTLWNGDPESICCEVLNENINEGKLENANVKMPKR